MFFFFFQNTVKTAPVISFNICTKQSLAELLDDHLFMKRHTRKGYFFFLDRINDLTMQLKIIVHGQTTYPYIYSKQGC